MHTHMYRIPRSFFYMALCDAALCDAAYPLVKLNNVKAAMLANRQLLLEAAMLASIKLLKQQCLHTGSCRLLVRSEMHR